MIWNDGTIDGLEASVSSSIKLDAYILSRIKSFGAVLEDAKLWIDFENKYDLRSQHE